MASNGVNIIACFNCGKHFKAVGDNDCYCADCREKCVEEDNKILDNLTQEQTGEILEAVLSLAKQDYLQDIKRWRSAKTEQDKVNKFNDLKGWCYWWKDICPVLTDGMIDGKIAQQHLNKVAYGKR